MSVVPADETRERLSPQGRLEALCDPGSLATIRSGVVSRRMGDRIGPGDGVVAGVGRIAGRPAVCYAQDASVAGGSLGEAHADTIVKALRLAGRMGAPVVGYVDSAGARMQEGTAALAGYGRIFHETVALGDRVPQIAVAAGTCAGGGSYSPALSDFIVMTEDACMFLTGPGVVGETLGEQVTPQELGGPRVQERNGVVQFVAPTDMQAALLVRELLSYLPQNTRERPPVEPGAPPLSEDPGDLVPDEARRVYDVRDVARAISDEGRLLEVSEKWSRNIVTAFSRMDGLPIGIVANQPSYLGGVLDAAASEKAARFVRTCDRFGLPLVVLVDTPGFMPGTRQEEAGVIRRGAGLVRAFSAATVPRVTVVLRKAYGGAFITMNSRDLGADLTFAWPQAEIGVMAPRQAVSVIHRRELDGAEDPDEERERLAAEYAREHLPADVAARDGFVDEVVPPAHTRDRLVHALGTLASARAAVA